MTRPHWWRGKSLGLMPSSTTSCFNKSLSVTNHPRREWKELCRSWNSASASTCSWPQHPAKSFERAGLLECIGWVCAVLLPFSLFKLLCRVNRTHYPGSNRGDTIYGVVMPSFDDKNCWKLLLGLISLFLSGDSSQTSTKLDFKPTKDSEAKAGIVWQASHRCGWCVPRGWKWGRRWEKVCNFFHCSVMFCQSSN